jgi:hypothetical protein
VVERESEIIDNLAMLLRLVTEGDQVIGFTPPDGLQTCIKHVDSDIEPHKRIISIRHKGMFIWRMAKSHLAYGLRHRRSLLTSRPARW